MLQAPIGLSSSPHVIVVGNEKGGSGKTTVAMHIAIALMKAGQRVATIDLDTRQKSLTHYAENRRAWAKRTHTDLELAVHFSVARAEGAKVHENEAAEFADKVITAVPLPLPGDRYSAARQLPDAACPFDRRHAGKPAQRQFPRPRRARDGRSGDLRGDRSQSLCGDGARGEAKVAGPR